MKKEKSPVSGLLLAFIGLGFAVLGYYQGEAETVFSKAIRICLECIGIG